MKLCQAFSDDPRSPAGIRVYQVTDDPEGAHLIYPDQPSFLADGRRFVVDTSTGPVVCDPDEGSLTPLFENGERHGVRVTLDGRYGYFTRRDGKAKRKSRTPAEQGEDNAVTIARIDLDTRKVEDVFHASGKLPGTDIDASQFSIATVSVDNQRIATTASRCDGKTPDAPIAILTLDLERGEARHVVEHRDFGNTHLQYCRSQDPEASHDLLVQMNHGSQRDAEGKVLRHMGPPSDGGVDIHVVRDDGTNWRDMPFGRDGCESCIGHQVWRGRGTSAATVTLQNLDTSYGWAEGARQNVVAGWPAPAEIDGPHLGMLNPGGERVLLTEGFPDPRFCHLACDDTGLKFTLDTFPIFDGQRAGMQVYLGAAPDERSPLTLRYVLNTGITFNGSDGYHAHPILSPDASILLFNSRITGTPQAYMVTGMWD